MLLAVRDDLLGGHRPDAGQPVELLGGRRVEMDRRRGRAAARRDGGRTPSLRRDEHLLAVRERGRQVDQRRIGVPRQAAGAGDRVGDARSLRQPVEPGPPDRAGDVDDEQPRVADAEAPAAAAPGALAAARSARPRPAAGAGATVRLWWRKRDDEHDEAEQREPRRGAAA